MKTKEKQYKNILETKKKFGVSKLGLMGNQVWNDDPKRFVFSLARYKFVSKILQDYNHVLEVGCGDGFNSRVVKQAVNKLTCIDFDPIFINNAKENINKKWKINFFKHDILKDKLKIKYDAIYSLDVLEHIHKKNEQKFLKNTITNLKKEGVYIVGMPSIESQKFASPTSKKGHVNCKTGESLKSLLKKYFKNVFLFSMNDEVVHTGFSKMAHYIICICCAKK